MATPCPKCGATIAAAPDAQGVVVCSGCGTRLQRPVASQASPQSVDLQTLVGEVRTVQRMQGEILQLQARILMAVKAPTRPATGSPAAASAAPVPRSGAVQPAAPTTQDGPPVVPPVRQRRKTVLVVDDDEQTRQEALAALQKAQVPARAVADGNAAIEAITAEKPDVLVIELGIAEPMPGKDLINVIKATMEWVDIPVVLRTRLSLEAQDVRTVHGADDMVHKGPGSAEALVNRVIQIFKVA